MKYSFEARLFPLEQNTAHIFIEFFLSDRHGTLQRVIGSSKDILSHMQQVFSKELFRDFEKILPLLIQGEITALLIDMKTSPSMAAITRKNLERGSFSRFRVLPSSISSILEQLSSVASLTWNGKRVLFDTLSTPFSLEALVEKRSSTEESDIELFLTRNQRDTRETISFPEGRAHFIMARPHLVLNGSLIQRLHDDIPWKALSIFSSGKSKISCPLPQVVDWIEDIEEDEELSSAFHLVICKAQEEQRVPLEAKPLHIRTHLSPILQFHDMRGLVSSLFIEYQTESHSTLFPFIPDFSFGKECKESIRDTQAEQQLETDLLSMGFERTTFDQGGKVSFRYFCPSEKIDTALELLLEVGWRVLDSYHKPIYLLKNIELGLDDSTLQCTEIEIEGLDKKKSWSDPLFFQGILKNNSIAPMDGYSLFLPLQLRPFLASIAEEIVIVSGQKVYFSSQKRGLLEAEKPLPITIKTVINSSILQETNQAIPFLGFLRPYQEAGVQWILERWKLNEPCLLADEMGLGKTVQILSWISKISSFSHKLPKKILIIAPKSLLYNWKKECERFLPQAFCYLYQGEAREKAFSQFLKAPKEIPAILITSFHTLRLDISQLQKISLFAVVVDEAQTVKNSESIAFQAIESLSKSFMVLLTGTPIENSMKDLWSLFSLLSTDLLGTSESFLGPFMTGDNSIVQRALKRVKKLINPFLLRRTKKLVAADLPELIEETVFVDMEQEEEARYFSFLQLLKEGRIIKSGTHSPQKERMQILEAITRLRQIVCHHELFSFQSTDKEMVSHSAKWELFFEEVQTLILDGKKVLIFSHFSAIIDRIVDRAEKEYGWRGVAYHGSMKKGSIESAVNAFQNNPNISFFATTMKSGGTGLNITAADAVLIYDPWWNRSVEDQAISRAHRIGRKEPVIVKRYITHQSIEERVYEIGKRKKELFIQLFDSKIDEGHLPNESSFDELLCELFHHELDRITK